jgi:hypothetical protein
MIVISRFKLINLRETAEDSALLRLDPISAVTQGNGARLTYGPAEKELLTVGEGF